MSKNGCRVLIQRSNFLLDVALRNGISKIVNVNGSQNKIKNSKATTIRLICLESLYITFPSRAQTVLLVLSAEFAT